MVAEQHFSVPRTKTLNSYRDTLVQSLTYKIQDIDFLLSDVEDRRKQTAKVIQNLLEHEAKVRQDMYEHVEQINSAPKNLMRTLRHFKNVLIVAARSHKEVSVKPYYRTQLDEKQVEKIIVESNKTELEKLIADYIMPEIIEETTPIKFI